MQERFVSWSMTHARGPYATPFLAILSFAESVIFPIPVDAVLVPLVMIKARSWAYYAFVASIASVLGGIAGYFIGLFLFSLVGSYIVSFYHLETEVALVSEWLSDNTFWATFVSAFTPIPYKVFTITAGLLHAPFLLFVLASLLGRSLRYFLLAYLTHLWGEAIARLIVRHFMLATLLFVLLVLVAYLLVQSGIFTALL